MASDVDLSVLPNICERTLSEVRGLRTEHADMRRLVLKTVELTRRVERRMSELDRRVDDLEIMIKAELGGQFAHVETRLENYVHDLIGRGSR